MQEILLINPNASAATTAMMVDIARSEAPEGFAVRGATATNGPSMIVNARELAASAQEVEQVWRSAGNGWAGVIVSAFGDPGADQLGALCDVPVVGIAQASMLEASRGGRRFGIATVTPELVASIEARAQALGLMAAYTGTRLTEGDPRALAADPQALEAALAGAVQRCIDEDGAEAVIIGGGPLGQAAIALGARFDVPLVAPISAAMRLLLSRMAGVS